MSLIPSLQSRFAVKQYNPEAVTPQEQIDLLIESWRLAPTSFNLQPFKLLEVTDKATRARIREEAAFGQPQVTDASHLFVIAAETNVDEATIARSIDRAAATRGVARNTLSAREDKIKGFVLSMNPDQRFHWAQRQAYIALGVLVATAAEAQIDVSPMEGFQPPKVDQILGLSDRLLRSTVLLAIGIRSDLDEGAHLKKVRKQTDEIFTAL